MPPRAERTCGNVLVLLIRIAESIGKKQAQSDVLGV